MELDAMKAEWADYDRKLDLAIRLNRQLLTAATMDRVRTPVRRYAALTGVGALFGLAVLVALGSFIYGHWSEPRFALPGVVLQAWSIAMLAPSVRMMGMALRIDYGMPVVTQWGLPTGQVV